MSELGDIYDPLGLLGRHLGQFRVGAGIAAVRSGTLYVGRDLANDKRQVWIQFFDGNRAKQVAALRRQADAWTALDDLSFAKVIGFEAEPDAPPLVAFDPVEGIFVCERLQAGALPPIEAVALIIDIGRALGRAHLLGLTHLGLSDETVLLSKQAGARARVIGFGLPTTFSRADVVGWNYLAPEQLASQSDCDARADIYALGVLLHRCVTAHFPIEIPNGATANQLAGLLLLGERRDSCEWLEPQLEPLAAVIRRATHRDRAERYQTADEFVAALKASGVVLPAEIEREQSERHHVRPRAPDAVRPAQRAGDSDRTFSPPASVPASAEPIYRAGAGDKTRRPTQAPLLSSAPALREVTPDSAPSDDPLLGQVICDLRFEKRVAEGGGGAVYYATNAAALNRSRAVKVMFHGVTAAAEQRFHQEALIMRQLKEANVPRIVDVYRIAQLPNGQWFIEMEWVRGRSLHQTIVDEGRIQIFRALKIIDSLSDTLEFAHRHGIVHRDVKPTNIIMEETHGRQTHKLRLLDWGVARGSGEAKVAKTLVDARVGTPGYMSPQAWMEMPLDGRADVFAVAAILYEMLVGRPPFEGENLGTICKATLELNPPPVSTLRPEVRRSVSDLAAAGLEKDVEKRPTMAEFRARLNEIMNRWNVEQSGGVVRGFMNTQLSSAAPAPLHFAQKPTQTRAPAPEDREFFQRISRRSKKRRSQVAALVVAAVLVAAAAAVAIGGLTRRTPQPTATESSPPVEAAKPATDVAPAAAPHQPERISDAQQTQPLTPAIPPAASKATAVRHHRATHASEAPTRSAPQAEAPASPKRDDSKPNDTDDDRALAPLPQQ